MAQARGSNAQIIFQEETTYRTDPSPVDAKKLHFVSESLKLSRNLLTSNIIRKNRNPVKPANGNIDIVGTIQTHLQAYQVSSFLKYTIGTANTNTTWTASTSYSLNALVTPTTENGYVYRAIQAGTSGASAPTWPTTIGNTVVDGTVTWRCEETKAASAYAHLLTISDSIPSFMIEKGFTDIGQYLKYNGCKINRLSLDIKSEGYQELNFDLIGAKETVSTSSFDSTPVDFGYTAFDGFSISSIKEGGSTIATVTEVSLSIENNLDNSVYVIASNGERVSLPEGVVKISGNIKAMFEDMTLYNKAINSTESSLEVTYKFGNGSGSSGNEYIKLLIPELKYSPNAPVIGGPHGVFVELPFEAFYDNSTGQSAIEILIKNTETNL